MMNLLASDLGVMSTQFQSINGGLGQKPFFILKERAGPNDGGRFLPLRTDNLLTGSRVIDDQAAGVADPNSGDEL